MYRDVTVAINLPQRRIYCRGDAADIYSWLVDNFFDQWAYLYYPQVLYINGELVNAMNGYWEIRHVNKWTTIGSGGPTPPDTDKFVEGKPIVSRRIYDNP